MKHKLNLSFMHHEKGFYSRLGALALPIIMQNLIMTSLGITDTIMVGFLGEAPMAGVTVANTPVYIIQLIIFGLQSGSAVLISQYWGKKDADAVSRVMGISFYLAGAISLVFGLIMILIPERAMSLFTDNPELIEISSAYIRIAGVSYAFNSITGVYTGAYHSMGYPKLGLLIYTISMCLNTFLNWVLIFGNLGFPAMGVEGAALATLISRAVEFAIMILHSRKSRRFVLNFKAVLYPGIHMLRKFLKYSTPVLVNETLWGIGTAIYPTVMGHMENSTEIMAAYTVAGNIDRLCTVFTFSIASVSVIVIGNEIGKGSSSDEVQDMGASLGAISIITGLVVGGILILLLFTVIDPYVYRLFNLSDMATSIASMMLFINSSVLFMRSFNNTSIVGVLRGGGDVGAAMFIDVVPLLFIAVPMAIICGIVLKTSVLWVLLAVVVDEIIKFILGIYRIRSKKWINDITVNEAK